MPDLNDEMKSIADYAIKSARDRYHCELGYSEESIFELEKILEKIYWGFSGFAQDEKSSGLILETARIWGSYLGEYIRSKWGGTWLQEGNDRLVLLNGVKLSPVNLVYRKITNNPESKIEDYLREAQRIMYRLGVSPQQAQYITKKINTYKDQISIAQPPKKRLLNKRLIYTLAGVGGILLILTGVFVGLSLIKSIGSPALAIVPTTNTSTAFSVIAIVNTETANPTNTVNPTVTPLPSVTPKPSLTSRPSATPTLTNTPIPTSTDSPTPTITPTRRKTATPTEEPSQTREPPTAPPTATATEPPPPTATEPPPPEVVSCEVNPSIVQAGTLETLTFRVEFSAPGYGFDTSLDPEFPGAEGCSGSDDNGDRIAECDGSSGMLPGATSVRVTFSTPLGNCIASYRSQ